MNIVPHFTQYDCWERNAQIFVARHSWGAKRIASYAWQIMRIPARPDIFGEQNMPFWRKFRDIFQVYKECKKSSPRFQRIAAFFEEDIYNKPSIYTTMLLCVSFVKVSTVRQCVSVSIRQVSRLACGHVFHVTWSHSFDFEMKWYSKATMTSYELLGGGFKHFLFSSLVGEDSHFDQHIFQMGWNHQPDYVNHKTVYRHRFGGAGVQAYPAPDLFKSFLAKQIHNSCRKWI